MEVIRGIFAALLGLAVGSFLNVCITRLPRRESIVSPRSRCPECRHPISGWGNIPLLSWALLHGRCRNCQVRIPLRYPLVEAATGGFFVLCFTTMEPLVDAIGAVTLFSLLVALCVTDAETMLLPDTLTLPGLAAGVVYRMVDAGYGAEHPVASALRLGSRALISAAVAAAALLAIRVLYRLLRQRTGLGLGDVKLFAMIAAWLGIREACVAFFLAVVAAAIYGVVLISLGRTHERQKKEQPIRIPLGSFLSLAGLYAMFFGRSTLIWYLHFLQ